MSTKSKIDSIYEDYTAFKSVQSSGDLFQATTNTKELQLEQSMFYCKLKSRRDIAFQMMGAIAKDIEASAPDVPVQLRDKYVALSAIYNTLDEIVDIYKEHNGGNGHANS